tara:strand:- start:3308 stop:3691 length:384 start_codon:yes stop_codon:yes gene_type:complete
MICPGVPQNSTISEGSSQADEFAVDLPGHPVLVRLRCFLVFKPDASHVFARQRAFIRRANAHDAATIRLSAHVYRRHAERETGDPALREQLASRVLAAFRLHPQPLDLLHLFQALELFHTDRQGSDL